MKAVRLKRTGRDKPQRDGRSGILGPRGDIFDTRRDVVEEPGLQNYFRAVDAYTLGCGRKARYDLWNSIGGC